MENVFVLFNFLCVDMFIEPVNFLYSYNRKRLNKVIVV